MQKKISFCSSFCVCVCQRKKKRKGYVSLMREILHAWQDVTHSCGKFYINVLGVRKSVHA